MHKDVAMLKIWGRKNSSNVRKALWIAHELGLDFESIDAGGAFGVVNEPHYRATARATPMAWCRCWKTAT